jgi:lysophospholipase L1-like esterase
MLGGATRWIAGLVAIVALAALATPAQAQATLTIRVLGDSYSSGNGAGDYDATLGCRRSSATYARQFAFLAAVSASHAPTQVTNAACSGAVTGDVLDTQLATIDGTEDVIFVTIGGNDVGFSSIVASCLLAFTRSPGSCRSSLASAERLVADGTEQRRLAEVLGAIRATAAPRTRIVLVGYPYLEGDPAYAVGAVQAGRRIRALSDAGDRIGAAITAPVPNAAYVSMTGVFAGHELTAARPNPNRWFVAPVTDAGLDGLDLWYHPTRAGHAAIALALFADPRVPKADVG